MLEKSWLDVWLNEGKNGESPAESGCQQKNDRTNQIPGRLLKFNVFRMHLKKKHIQFWMLHVIKWKEKSAMWCEGKGGFFRDQSSFIFEFFCCGHSKIKNFESQCLHSMDFCGAFFAINCYCTWLYSTIKNSTWAHTLCFVLLLLFFSIKSCKFATMYAAM